MVGGASLLIIFTVALFGYSNALWGTDDFFLYRDKETTYKQGSKDYTADITCWTAKAPNCDIRIRELLVRNSDREYTGIKDSRIRFKDGCPPVVCAKNCGKFVVSTKDKCPICLCKNFMTREPCRTKKDCPSEADRCRPEDNVCEYAKPNGADQWLTYCQLTYDCPAFHACKMTTATRRSKSIGQCVKNAKVDYHIPEKGCWFSSDCRLTGFTCDQRNTCVAKDGYCLIDDHCRDQYECDKKLKKCVKSKYGQPKPTTTPKPSRCSDCYFWQPCRPDFTCGTFAEYVKQIWNRFLGRS